MMTVIYKVQYYTLLLLQEWGNKEKLVTTRNKKQSAFILYPDQATKQYEDYLGKSLPISAVQT